MLAAITTHYLGPTYARPGRIKATCQAGSVIQEYDHGLNPTANHVKLARTLAHKLGWVGTWYGGALPGKPDGLVFVCTVDVGDPDFVITA